ncbi:disease resistance protein RPM1 [Vigna unguiculata]|uniref:Disease resistance protein RPM1 n=1 Tax=Vigna unguiculata TaxID=3917 RepID=A0A4D6LBD3_VIGUN|nr:disease resistance protein RPM1 [Vigna unguiculata]
METEMVTGALVSTLLERTIDTLASRFVDIFRATKPNKKQLSDLRMKLLAIDVVAFDAEQKQFTDPRVRDWLLRAKDAVFVAEDLLDEIDYQLLKTQVEAESQSATNKEEKNRFIMHDLLLDLAKYVCGDICIRLGVDEPQGLPKRTRHFSFATDRVQTFDGFENLIDTQKLHTFVQTSWRKYPRYSMSIDDLFSKFKYIRVLSMYHFHILKVPKSIGNLKHLRSIDLSYTNIEKLPDSIGLLYKLQILKLKNCQTLKELPSCLLQLHKLCCLELINTEVKNVHILGKLKNLQVLMNSFCVDIHKEPSIQQLGQINLHGSLRIGELQNIENPSYALEADLKNKPHLVELMLEWNIMGSSPVDSTKARDVIENLQPSKHLKKLSICDYVGKEFPNWVLDNSLPNLVSLELEGCESCERLPPLGLLPSLKDLSIERLDGIVSIDADFHGNNYSSFKSLQTLTFSHMMQWEKWECEAMTGAFPRLQHLYIYFCPKLKGQLPERLVPLETLHITNCKQLEGGRNVLFDWATMKSLTLVGDNMEASFLEMVRDIVPDNSIQYLRLIQTIIVIVQILVTLSLCGPFHYISSRNSGSLFS